jgi:hypothetical protein
MGRVMLHSNVTLNLFQGPSTSIAMSPAWMLKQVQGDGFDTSSVIPAKAGISGRKITALHHETPACAGVTN